WLQTALLLDQSRHKLSIHRPSFSQLAPRVIVLPRHSQPTAHPADAYPDGQPLQRFYRSMGGSPPTFFLNSATSLIPARSQAMRVNCRSSARSMLASANARSSARTRRFNCSVSLISSGVSTRILLPQLPLPYLRTQLGTVAAPLIPYLCRTRSQATPSCSTSRTTCILKASLYRIPAFCLCCLAIRGDNLFQDGTQLSTFNFQLSTYSTSNDFNAYALQRPDCSRRWKNLNPKRETESSG